jgi:hypothetical protein
MNLCSGFVNFARRFLGALAMVARKRGKALKRVTRTLDPDDFVAIDQLAHRSEVSSSCPICVAVREFLERRATDARIFHLPLEGGKT